MSWLRPIDAWFASSILPHEADLLRQARRWSGNDDEARDLVHEAYTQLLQLSAWDHIGTPAAYAARMIRNLALQRMRRAQIVPIRQFAALEELDHPDLAPDSFAVCAGRDEMRRVMAAINRLPPASRRVVLLRKFEELPPREIAKRLGLSLSTVEKHLSRGMFLLVRALREPVATAALPDIPRDEADRREA
ncbi:RNA polymerase sigma factor [Sphingomonas nostoxanthinifaciens]|uniref:RNA polymerase sigma factor n=1 Tax=Sphingomonas nostoxanthinifaciens TaxID=2872652 RepID=UPI001CC1F1C7|nr:sigma-70 family RNA polymerase sigma factor [Sphingomonas nostoxanthinifaciens]UAK23348.1 sigma-70 family RNA polymerase sigma factor [Sphingomonas nostoxanthinifaciens]